MIIKTTKYFFKVQDFNKVKYLNITKNYNNPLSDF